ncbi:hypothetical protein [Alteromonas antoniana]|uniref:hypothetical protein n=1 Tax=Alteromonas antoniana TaxID=2803813 RepID=UPI001C45D9F1|nr:hypothetical protein [Alteromonas antoniana]
MRALNDDPLGLDSYLMLLRKQRHSYAQGLLLATTWAKDRGGIIDGPNEDGVTSITVGEEQAHCFLLFSDIDRFYFET